MALKILLCGASGHMGKVIASAASRDPEVSIVAGYDIKQTSGSDFSIYADFSEIKEKIDVLIDFSNPAAFDSICNYALAAKVPCVFATTGLSDEQKEKMRELSLIIPVFHSANMSLGVNLLIAAAKRIAMKTYRSFDIEIVEKHHRRKLDAPSGTALGIADAINSVLPEKFEYVYDREPVRKPRSDSEIGISAVRGGTIVGEHTVIFAGNDELIEISHTAMSREIFATGAIAAAKYLYKLKPGFFSMDDMLSED